MAFLPTSKMKFSIFQPGLRTFRVFEVASSSLGLFSSLMPSVCLQRKLPLASLLDLFLDLVAVGFPGFPLARRPLSLLAKSTQPIPLRAGRSLSRTLFTRAGPAATAPDTRVATSPNSPYFPPCVVCPRPVEQWLAPLRPSPTAEFVLVIAALTQAPKFARADPLPPCLFPLPLVGAAT